MTHATHPDVHIPGTYMFDGRAAMKGYPLNKMCYSFNSKENREEFLKDEDAYCTKTFKCDFLSRGLVITHIFFILVSVSLLYAKKPL